jgi:hypothetical protein
MKRILTLALAAVALTAFASDASAQRFRGRTYYPSGTGYYSTGSTYYPSTTYYSNSYVPSTVYTYPSTSYYSGTYYPSTLSGLNTQRYYYNPGTSYSYSQPYYGGYHSPTYSNSSYYGGTYYNRGYYNPSYYGGSGMGLYTPGGFGIRLR